MIKRLTVLFVLLMSWGAGWAQNATGRVTGTVVSEKDEALAGANVNAFNPQTKESVTVPTNDRGLFEFRSLTSGQHYNITVTHIGYATRLIRNVLVRPNENNSIIIKMVTGANDLDQFVVVGYGTQRKGDLTGAVAQVGGEVLQDKPLPNVSRGLQGVIPNLNITMTDG